MTRLGRGPIWLYQNYGCPCTESTDSSDKQTRKKVNARGMRGVRREDHPEELMDAHDVSPIVNSAKYDGPECSSLFQMMRQHTPVNCPRCKQC
jgi:hypothetical protein